MFQGWLCVGGVEIGNNARARGYAESAECPVGWFVDDDCPTLADALGDADAYELSRISSAPWFDPDDETTSRFYGVYLTTLGDISSSTRQGSFTEGILEGGTPERSRHAGKQFRVRAWLTAAGEDALETGHSWLNAALEATACSTHPGGSCGATDATFMTACPPPRLIVDGAVQTDEEYEASLSPLVRHLHDVTCISGPIEIETRQSSDGIHWGRLVEFTLYAGKPWLYGDTRRLDLSPTPATVIQDVPFNLVPSPSAELSGGSVTVATNFTTNPSLELNATGWASRADGTYFTGAMIAGGRVTGELAAVGTSSFRTVLTTSAAGTAALNSAWFAHDFETNFSGRPLGARMSINVWSAAVIMSGTPTLAPIRVYAFWRATSGGAAVRTDLLGEIPANGGVVSVRSLLPPSNANYVLVRPQLPITAWGAGNVVRLYSDALAVTVP